MIQDIAPHIFNNQYIPKLPVSECYVLYFHEDKVLANEKDGKIISFPKVKDLVTKNQEVHERCVYLFSIDDMEFYLLDNVKPPEGFNWKAVTFTMKSESPYLKFAAATGYQLYRWYSERKYCSNCASPLLRSDKSRSLYCPSCGKKEYPQLAPGVIIGLTNGDKILLAEYPDYDQYALLAGFTEIGETLEETVAREVMEEVGLKVKNIHYYKSQPWAYGDIVLAGFFCDVDEPDPNKIVLDKNELLKATWVDRKNIPVSRDEEEGSLTHHMMQAFKNNII